MHPTRPSRIARRLRRASIYDAPLTLPPVQSADRRVLLPVRESERRVLVRRLSSKTLQLKAS